MTDFEHVTLMVACVVSIINFGMLAGLVVHFALEAADARVARRRKLEKGELGKPLENFKNMTPIKSDT